MTDPSRFMIYRKSYPMTPQQRRSILVGIVLGFVLMTGGLLFWH
jgi:hypothetical protein